MTFDHFVKIICLHDHDVPILKSNVIGGKFQKMEGFGDYVNKIIKKHWQVIKHLII